jgi:hypothetical protein
MEFMKGSTMCVVPGFLSFMNILGLQNNSHRCPLFGRGLGRFGVMADASNYIRLAAQ